jgi:Flp pilus assembly pilin Flp
MLQRLTRRIAENVSTRQEGQGLLEYGLILVTVSIAVVVALFALAPRINALFTTVGASLPG